MDKKSRELVMAKLYFRNKDYKMAEKSFNEYLNINPEDVAASKLLAQVYEQNKRFDKAFEMYERCYLAEPDRTGVLLDICRILLMNEIWLEHVDYRKWLNLAIKAFPSNPIVVNFKAFLSTLPPDDQSSPQREIPSSKSNYKTPGEDPLLKILEKLSIMEKKIESIDQRLANNKPPSGFSFAGYNSSFAGCNPSPIINKPESDVAKLNLITESPAKSTFNFSDTKKPESDVAKVNLLSEAPATSAFNFSNIKTPESDVARLNSTTEIPATSAFNFSNIKTPESDVARLNSTTETPATSAFNFSTIKKPESDVARLNSTTETPATSAFNFSTIKKPESDDARLNLTAETPAATSTFNLSNNLFAESIRRLNIPTEGAWTTQNTFSFSQPRENVKADDNDNDEGEGTELVPNEELEIENTCDMQPIEIKTGEEDEDILFEHRCKLFRFRDKEYKERGLGAIKVLRHKDTGKGRLIMRREVIGLVCLNCWDCSKIERVRETQVRWIGIDASDGEAGPTVFLAKFKTQELTDTFMSHLSGLFPEDGQGKDGGSANTSLSSPQPKVDNVGNSANPSMSTKEKPEIELIDPELDQSLVDKARELKLPDLFYHKLKNQEPCGGCNGCEKDD